MAQWNWPHIILAICIVVGACLFATWFIRGAILDTIARKQRQLTADWERFKIEQEKWKERFEEDHQSPWVIHRTTKSRTSP